jgi:hypothetical protein
LRKLAVVGDERSEVVERRRVVEEQRGHGLGVSRQCIGQPRRMNCRGRTPQASNTPK